MKTVQFTTTIVFDESKETAEQVEKRYHAWMERAASPEPFFHWEVDVGEFTLVEEPQPFLRFTSKNIRPEDRTGQLVPIIRLAAMTDEDGSTIYVVKFEDGFEGFASEKELEVVPEKAATLTQENDVFWLGYFEGRGEVGMTYPDLNLSEAYDRGRNARRTEESLDGEVEVVRRPGIDSPPILDDLPPASPETIEAARALFRPSLQELRAKLQAKVSLQGFCVNCDGEIWLDKLDNRWRHSDGRAHCGSSDLIAVPVETFPYDGESCFHCHQLGVGNVDCTEHCHPSKDGKHTPDFAVRAVAAHNRFLDPKLPHFIGEIGCKECDVVGTFAVESADISW